MMVRRSILIFVALIFGSYSWSPAPASAASQTQPPVCEPWQMPDGMGGCVDRCPPEQQWKDGECRPRPCPADRIDLNGNGEDNGDCEPMDLVNVPRPVAANCSEVGDFGTMRCSLIAPFSALAVYGSPGCLRINRNYFPRAIVNRQVTFQISGVIPSDDLPSTNSDEGYYRTVAANPNMVWGRTLGEETQGTLAFDVARYLRDNLHDAHPYPNIDNVTAYLEMQRVGDTRWSIAGGSGGVQVGNPRGDVLQATFRRSSFPGPGTSMADDGPNETNTANELPSYRLSVTSRWAYTYVVSYDFYTINANAYQYAGSVVGFRLSIFDSGNARPAFRVLGGKQGGSLQLTTGLDYCVSELDAYVPVPVIEMQSVLR